MSTKLNFQLLYSFVSVCVFVKSIYPCCSSIRKALLCTYWAAQKLWHGTGVRNSFPKSFTELYKGGSYFTEHIWYRITSTTEQTNQALFSICCLQHHGGYLWYNVASCLFFFFFFTCQQMITTAQAYITLGLSHCRIYKLVL